LRLHCTLTRPHTPSHPHTHATPHKQWISAHHSYNFDVSKGPIKVEWFKGAQTNITYNCLDRWVPLGGLGWLCG